MRRLIAAALVLGLASTLGVSAQDPSADTRGGVGIVVGKIGDDIVVGRLIKGCTAEKIGLQPGDVLLKIDGTAVTGAAQARVLFQKKKKDAEIKVEVSRGAGEKKETKTLTGKVMGIAEMGKAAQKDVQQPLLGKQAKPWFAEWYQLPKGMKEVPTLANCKGKVVVFHCFQSW